MLTFDSCSGSLCVAVLAEEPSEFRGQVHDTRRSDLPDEFVIDDGIPVRKHVAEGDDPWQVRNQGGRGWVDATESVECLADDLELPLHC